MISIIIVSHGHEKYFQKLIDGLKKFMNLPFELILIDNKGDGTFFANILESNVDNFKVIRNLSQYSFSRNNNTGVSFAKYDNILLLNPDTWLEDFTLSNFLDNEKLDNSTLYYPQLYNFDGTLQMHSKPKPRFFDTLLTFFSALFKIKRSPKKGDYWFLGAAILFKKELFYSLNGFDENFPLYGEDAELCDRSRKFGYKIIHLKNIKIFHLLHDQGKTKYIRKQIISSLYYFYKSFINGIESRKRV